jgi:hypothetical protein
MAKGQPSSRRLASSSLVLALVVRLGMFSGLTVLVRYMQVMHHAMYKRCQDDAQDSRQHESRNYRININEGFFRTFAWRLYGTHTGNDH